MPYKRLWQRAPLVLLGVLVAHSLAWEELRAWTCGSCVLLSGWLGLPVVRLGEVTFGLPGWPMTIGVSCTMIDVFCGAVPLLWPSWRRLALFFVGLMALNLARLVGGFWLLHHGVPWALCHEAAAGLVFFLILEWLSRERPQPVTSCPPCEGTQS